MKPPIPSSDDSSPNSIDVQPKPPFYRLIIANLCLCIFITSVNEVNFVAVAPAVAKALDATSSQTYLCNAVLLLSKCISQPIYGALAEAFGRRKGVLAAILIFALTSLLSAFSQNIEWLIAVRVVEGFAMGGMAVSATVILSDIAPLRERARLNGIIALAGALGLVVGMISGAAAAERWWRIIFWVNLPIAILSFVVFLVSLRVGQPKALDGLERLKEVDWTGLCLLAGSTASLIYGLTTGGTLHPWHSPSVICSLTIGGIGIIVLAIYEHFLASTHGLADPFLSPRLFCNRTTVLGYVLTFFNGAVLWALPHYYLLYLNISASKSIIESGILLLPGLLTIPVSAGVAGALMTLTARYKHFNIAGFVLTAAGMACLATMKANPATGAIVGFQLLVGTGTGIVIPGKLVQVQAALRGETAGDGRENFDGNSSESDKDERMATSLVGFVTSLGQAFGVALGSTVMLNTWAQLLSKDMRNCDITLAHNNNCTDYLVPASQAAQAADIIANFRTPVAEMYRDIAAASVARIWEICVGFAIAGCLAAMGSRNIKVQK